MYVLGINAYHGDSSACLIKNGELISAVEEERFRRVKHWAGFPSESIGYCLDSAGVTLSEIDILAINQDSRANIWKKLGFTLANRPDLKFLLDRAKNKQERASVESQLKKYFSDQQFSGKIAKIEHHEAHMSSSFHVSPFQEATVVSVDGFGDFASGAWGVGKGTKVNIDGRVYFPHSLGIFYQALTQYIGFPHYGDEYKVMGLAPYGKPKYMDEMRKIVLLQLDGSYKLNTGYFRHHKEKVDYEWENGSPVVGELYSTKLFELLGPARRKGDKLTQYHFDIAHSVQKMYEEAFFHLLNTLYQRHGLDNLALSGGCAMNSVANGKVYRNTPFKNIYIQSAAGDAGGAIGAATSAWFQENPIAQRSFVMDHAYCGPEYTNDQIREDIDGNAKRIEEEKCSVEFVSSDNEIFRRTAQHISEGKVIGWFQGRMEWGPRALGNRSILCDPRRQDMKDILNLKIKRRESFRPFAPSILREEVRNWFEEEDDVPFMMQVFQINKEKRTDIPAVTHIDGSGRLQTVTKATNPRYYGLIQAFFDLTGVPILLNTSFNENEPVVCKPSEALDCFLRTKMDVLVMGDWILERKQD